MFRPLNDVRELPGPARDSTGSSPRCAHVCRDGFGGLGQLYLLMPPDIATTAAAYPTLYWYQPTAGRNRIEVNLYQYDAVRDEVAFRFNTAAVISGEPGIAALPLADQIGVAPLAVGEIYYWEVLFFCDPDSCDADRYAWGWLQRVEVDAATAQQLADASLSEQVAIAVEAGLWLEAVAGLTTLIRQQPEAPDLQRRWAELLDSVGLEALTDEPLL